MPETIGGGLSFCDREWTAEELNLIRQISRNFSNLSLTELAHTIGELLECAPAHLPVSAPPPLAGALVRSVRISAKECR